MSGTMLGLLRELPRPLRFLLAGGSAAAINWLVRFPLSEVMPFLAAVLVAAVIGMLVGFVLYRHFVFAASRRPLMLEARDFFIVNLVSSVVVALIAAGLLALALRFGMAAKLAEAVAHAAAIGLGAVLNYFGHSLATFAPRLDMRERGTP
ncbi:GtrA family protein [Roseomonas frigidaquae]|uniref:GtrA family protein n=1 Tax=Falsiroseomonas frigidaquae TaxID=487318 RepID=A0ABX1EU89_9PROT|nr:GtrA family protein [Falsiroseomonas frigidaquae]NKE44147.1 GtrA family protein [Falsiroseomonas frigidaquae]